MKNAIRLLAVISLFVLGAAGSVQAAAIQVFVTCVQQQPDEMLYIQFGYESDAQGTSPMLSYIGNVNIFMDGVEAGRDDNAASVTLNQSDNAMFSVSAWFGDEFIYSDIWVDYNTTGNECNPPDEPTVTDDNGVVNDPAVNPRANACYNPGQVCVTQGDWIAGYYLIRR